MFSRRHRDKERRHTRCLTCRAEYQREWRVRARQRKLKGHVHRLSQTRRDERAVVALAKMLLKQYGGANGLCSKLQSLIEDARRSGDHRTAMHGVNAIMNLAKACSRLEQTG